MPLGRCADRRLEVRAERAATIDQAEASAPHGSSPMSHGLPPRNAASASTSWIANLSISVFECRPML
jgi:hypothetical protein